MRSPEQDICSQEDEFLMTIGYGCETPDQYSFVEWAGKPMKAL